MRSIKFIMAAALLAIATVAPLAQAANVKRQVKPVKFTVRVQNISVADGQMAKNGAKWSFALSPGLWVLNEKKFTLFTEGKPASKGLEMQAEDGMPAMLAQELVETNHASFLHGVFNTPAMAMAPGPIRPGETYEFTVTAMPGMKLMLTMMNGQSNDEFYAPEADGVALFDAKGVALTGDVTRKFVLWDAGTEVNEELGVGANQGPRQAGLNTGADEHGVVRRATKEKIYNQTAKLFRVVIVPEPAM
jgi:hypothetical protein